MEAKSASELPTGRFVAGSLLAEAQELASTSTEKDSKAFRSLRNTLTLPSLACSIMINSVVALVHILSETR